VKKMCARIDWQARVRHSALETSATTARREEGKHGLTIDEGLAVVCLTLCQSDLTVQSCFASRAPIVVATPSFSEWTATRAFEALNRFLQHSLRMFVQ
jgi:hypothetical protein